ncbi:MAG TPA: prolipoprotein diacylglyceryl transferase [Rickettsiales bacterium]|nr:prolipoprotein diacylglyceryl transferase [Rickettsiales bacterium]
MYLPILDPIIFQIGPLAIRWYSLAYIFGIIFAWFIINYFNKKQTVFNEKAISDDFFLYIVLSIILGGRIGYVLFYNTSYYLQNPLDIIKIWQGGMSFHGGLIGCLIGIYLLCKKHKINYWAFCDLLAVATPIGLFFGRIANFVNMELYGRITTSKIGIIFPNGGPLPRHPSQLYEAFFEGLILFCILFCLARFTKIRRQEGVLSGLFLIGYSISRFSIEFFREPDSQIGYILQYFTLGQILSLPIFIFGCYLISKKLR